MHGMGFGGSLGFGHGLVGVLFWVVLILVVVALIKYLFFHDGERR